MMIVSTCRLDMQRDLRRGYVLHITNLEDRDLEYEVAFVLTMPQPLLLGPTPSRLDLENHVAVVGPFATAQGFRRVGSDAVYSKKIRIWIGGHQTSFIAIEPTVARGFAAFRPTLFEHLEGYVTLSLPVRRRRKNRVMVETQVLAEPQSLTPVRVLLNPETRTFNRTGGHRMDLWEDEPPIPASFHGPAVDPPPRQTGFTFVPLSWTERIEPLHVATGKAENELTPDGGLTLTREGLHYALNAIESDDPGDYRGSSAVADEDRAGALIELLMEVGEDPEMAKAINQALDRYQARVRLRQP
jgi:hypothetical protein